MSLAAEPRDVRPATAVDRLLHEPSRLVIATLLFAVDSADFLYLLHESGLSKGNLSSHLARLEAGGYVAIEKTFRGKIPLTIGVLGHEGSTVVVVLNSLRLLFMKSVEPPRATPPEPRGE